MEIEEFVPVKKDLAKKIYLLRFIIILLMIITLIIAYLIIKNKKGYKLNLVGENEVSIHINEEYNDPGCEVLDDDGRTRQGILFRKSREDLAEALFIKYLYRLSRSLLRRENDDNINRLRERMDETDDENMNRNRLQQIESYQRNKEIGNKRAYCRTLYIYLRNTYKNIIYCNLYNHTYAVKLKRHINPAYSLQHTAYRRTCGYKYA